MPLARAQPAGQAEFGFLPRSFAIWMMAAYIALFIIRPWEILVPTLQSIRFERYFAISLIVVVGLTRGFRFPRNLQTASALALMAALGLSTATAYNVPMAWDSYYVILTVFMCSWLLLSVIRTPYELIFILGAYVVSMEFYVGKALWEYFLHDRQQIAMGVTRLIGIEYSFGDANRVANSIAISLPIWLLFWRCRREIFARWPGIWRKCALGALAAYPVLGVAGVLLTNSRGGMLNLCVFAVLWRLGSGRALRNLAVVALILGIGWLALPQEQKGRLETIWNPTLSEDAEASKQGRVEAFQAAVEIGRRFPLTGVGPGNFGAYRSEYVDGSRMAPHGLLNELLAELGALGLVAFALMIGTTLAAIRRTKLRAVGSSESTLHVLSSSAHAFRNSLILLGVEGLTLNSLYRFNWLWLVAFSMLALRFASEISVNTANRNSDAAS